MSGLCLPTPPGLTMGRVLATVPDTCGHGPLGLLSGLEGEEAEGQRG